MQLKPLKSYKYFYVLLGLLTLVFFAISNSQLSNITMADEPTIVTLSVSGLPPAYTERRWQIEISTQQRKDFDDLLERSHFFKLPTRLGENTENGRDMGTYSITVKMNSRNHTVEFSDSSITQELADLMKFLKDSVR
jgi:hypothetical protein